MSYNSHQILSGKRTLARQLIYIALLVVITQFNGGWQIDQALGGNSPSFQYEHRQPGNFSANQRTGISVFIEAAAGVQNVRLYFRPGSASEYYFVKLSPDADGKYSGELPAFTELVTDLEYLFLWKNGPRQIVRTKPYRLTQAQSKAFPQSTGAPITAFTEKKDGAVAELNNLLSEVITIGQLTDTQHLGKRAGLFDMADDPRYRYGYFGAYVYDAAQNITNATQGYVNFVADSGVPKESEDFEKIRAQQTEDGYPNVRGDGWRGKFIRTDRPLSLKKITAEIIYSGNGRITVITSLSGRGHYLTGFISKGLRGEVYLVDHYDQEVWTTHDLRESSSTYFGFEDYATPLRGRNAPLYQIELSRSNQDLTEEDNGCFINAVTN